MYQAQAIIERVRRVSAAVQRLDLAVDKLQRNIGAGQIYLARTTESLDPYLREPWVPVQRTNSTITIERPATQQYSPGQDVNLLGPIGKPIPLRDTVKTLLLIAYDSAPTSLIMLAEHALAKKLSVAIALLGAAVHYPLEGLPTEIEVIRGDNNGAWPNQQETLKWADQVVAVAPPPFDTNFYTDLLKLSRVNRIDVPSNYLYGLMQPPLPCGIGACQACLIRCGKDELPACIDGPAFDLTTLSLLAEGNKHA
jgi:dihydroorotate dehydrogenase electron transfer subunit